MSNRRVQRATGSAAISTTIDPDVAYGSVQLALHLSAAGGAGDLTVTLNANAGAAYDTVLLTQDMTTVTDLIWGPLDGLMEFESGDQLVIAWANANTRTYGLTVTWRQMH